MTSFVLLAAGEWIKFVVYAVVFLVWLINQLAALRKKAAAAPPQANRPLPPVDAGRPPNPNAPPGAAPGRGGLVDEVEEFLRQARKSMADPNAAQKQRQPSQQRPAVAKQKQPNRGKQQGQRKQESQKSRGPSPGERSLGGSVSQHVAEHLDTTSRFDERAGKLSHLKQTVDQDIGEHVHRVLDHKLGRFAAQAETTAGDDGSGAHAMDSLIAMLRDPASMRNAIILQEILAPPTHRW